MSIRGKIKRLGLLIEYIESNHYPSKQELRNLLSDEGFETSSRTIDRDIEAIRDEFWLEIAYDRARNGYYINASEKDHTATLLKIFNLVNTTDVLIDNLKEGRQALEYFQFDGSEELRGVSLLPLLVKAIKKFKEVAFTYQSHYAQESRNIQLKPLLLKEYSKRWYIIGYNDYVKGYRTYGIDRMTELKTLNKTFKPALYRQPKDFFTHTIGLTLSPDKPELIRIQFTRAQAEYIKALPLHHSQEIVSETDNAIVMTYYVIPNFEFKQKIMMQMDNAVVLEPKALAEEIKGIAQDISINYTKKTLT